MTIEAVWTDRHRRHRPATRAHLGAIEPAQEVMARGEAVYASLVADADVRLHGPTDQDLAPILAVHEPGLVDFLSTVVERWRAEGLPLDRPAIVPWAFPHPGLGSASAARPSGNLLAQVGDYCGDTITVVLDGTWEAAVAAAHSAVTAASLVAGGAGLAFAAVRPPGHHAGPAQYGGSCFLNNAAVAAQWLASRDQRVAVVDIDAHHGQGTQEIFYDRSDVYYGSVHVDPVHEYPYWCGFSSERGRGLGSGTNRNEPVLPGTGDTTWLEALGRVLDEVVTFRPDVLVVSLGVDGLAEDPNADLRLTPEAYAEAGRLLGGLGPPLVGVLEGGYVLELLGPTLLGFLHAADRAR